MKLCLHALNGIFAKTHFYDEKKYPNAAQGLNLIYLVSSTAATKKVFLEASWLKHSVTLFP